MINEHQAAQVLGLKGQITHADVKKAYREKAREYHPDRNPSGADMMKLINAAYDVLKNTAALTVEENATLAEYPEILSKVLNAINTLDGLVIEVCGLWVWVTGNTKMHKDTLKSQGFKWAKNKGSWFYRPDIARSKNRYGAWDMEQIRATYGSIKSQVKTNYIGQAAS